MVFPINTLPTSLAGGGPNIITQGLVGIGLLPPQWGIFDSNGRSVISFDTVIDFDYRRDWTIADYPLERGSFESYDKVQTPFTVKLTLGTGGSIAARQAFLDSIAAIEDDLKLYTVITPEVSYPSVNIEHVDYKRSNGIYGIINVSIYLVQIRQTTSATLSSSSPSGADTQSGGQVQPQQYSAADMAKIQAAFDAPETVGGGGGP